MHARHERHLWPVHANSCTGRAGNGRTQRLRAPAGFPPTCGEQSTCTAKIPSPRCTRNPWPIRACTASSLHVLPGVARIRTSAVAVHRSWRRGLPRCAAPLVLLLLLCMCQMFGYYVKLHVMSEGPKAHVRLVSAAGGRPQRLPCTHAGIGPAQAQGDTLAEPSTKPPTWPDPHLSICLFRSAAAHILRCGEAAAASSRRSQSGVLLLLPLPCRRLRPLPLGAAAPARPWWRRLHIAPGLYLCVAARRAACIRTPGALRVSITVPHPGLPGRLTVSRLCLLHRTLSRQLALETLDNLPGS